MLLKAEQTGNSERGRDRLVKIGVDPRQWVAVSRAVPLT